MKTVDRSDLLVELTIGIASHYPLLIGTSRDAEKLLRASAAWSPTHGANPSQTYAVVFAADDEYSLPLAVAWHSLVEFSPLLASSTPIKVLHNRLSGSVHRVLAACAADLDLDVEFIDVRLPDLRYHTALGGAIANYLRLGIADVVTDATRVLYLDADIIVRRELSPLLAIDLGDYPIGCVPDQIAPSCAVAPWTDWWADLGIARDRQYFNSGVMVLDLPACRHAGLLSRAIDVVRRYPERMRLWDQDALNLAADDQWKRLPRTWNTFPMTAILRTPWVRHSAEAHGPMEELALAERQASVLHFVSPAKPWKRLLPHGYASIAYSTHLNAVRATCASLPHAKTTAQANPPCLIQTEV